MNNEKSNSPMSERESLSYGSEALRECDDKIHQMVTQLRERNIVGPLYPALQHLEEAAFWIRRCMVTQDETLLKMRESSSMTATANNESEVCVNLPNLEHLKKKEV